tara:strand:- start:31 stop:825 length:795 start_codon:yes stop_codon:yes gene_type:complete
MKIYTHDDLDYKKINYSKPEKQGTFYYSSINYDNQPLYLQTPKMICKKNISELIDKGNYNLEMETINNNHKFYDSILNIDDNNVKKTHQYSKEWFEKELPLDVIDNMYKRTCKPVKKDNKPLFSFKIPMNKNKVYCQVYDQNKICADISKLTENTEIICILHIKGLKFLKQHYYCDFYISQIKIFVDEKSKYSILNEYCINDENEEKENLAELERELMLDEDFIQGFKETEKNKLLEELKIENEKLESQQKIVNEIQKKLDEYK